MKPRLDAQNDTTPRGAGRPRYAAVAQALIEDITSGRHAVGALLPTEQDLRRQFGISRHTAREALRRLQALGLVTRRAGIGTTVVADRIAQRYVQIGDTVADLHQYARDMVLHLESIDDVEAEADLAAQLGCAEGQAWTRAQGLRKPASGGGAPLALTVLYVARAYRGVLDDADVSGRPVHSLIERRYGIVTAEVSQTITAVALTEQDAALLDARGGAPALRIVRRYLSEASELFEVAINLYPGDRFSCSSTLRLDAGEAVG